MLYLDTSAYLKRFNNEESSELIKKIFTKSDEYKLEIATSIWTVSEAIASLDQAYKKRGIIDVAQRNSTISSLLGKTFDMVKEGKMQMIIPNEDLIYGSWDMIRLRHLSADDALHAFSAKVGKCDSMVLADNYFSNRLKNYKADETEPTRNAELSYQVYNVLDKNDYEILEQKIDSI